MNRTAPCVRPTMRGIAFGFVSLLMTLCALSWGRFDSEVLQSATTLLTQAGTGSSTEVCGQDAGNSATFGDLNGSSHDDLAEPSEAEGDPEAENDGDLVWTAKPSRLQLAESVSRNVLLRDTTIDLKDRSLLKTLGARGPPTI